MFTEDVDKILRLWRRVQDAIALVKYIDDENSGHENSGHRDTARTVLLCADKSLYDALGKVKVPS